MRVVIGLLMILTNFKYLMMTNLRDVLHIVGKSSIIGVMFCVTIIWLTAIFGFDRSFNHQIVEYKSIFTIDYSKVEWFKSSDSNFWSVIFQAATGVYFTMLNPQFVFPLISHLKKPNRKRVEYIFRWAHLE